MDEFGADFYIDAEDRARLMSLPEVEREEILTQRYERKKEIASLKETRKRMQREREDKGDGDGKRRPPPSEDRIKRKEKLDLMKGKRKRKNEKTKNAKFWFVRLC